MHWNYIIIQVQKRERIANLCIWIHKNTNKFWEKKALCRFLKKTHLPQDRDTCNHLHLRRKVGKLRDSPGFSQGLIPFPASKVSRPQPAMVVAIKEANKVKSVCLIRSSVLRRNLKKKGRDFFQVCSLASLVPNTRWSLKTLSPERHSMLFGVPKKTSETLSGAVWQTLAIEVVRNCQTSHISCA